ncbi:heparin lyase I family protein [Caballeronia grimmiae]|uniref:heparin lyase I family protein n=1 Tax=Caballeronia grimmiae TaxID=1071679 RepID=UPI0038BD33A1
MLKRGVLVALMLVSSTVAAQTPQVLFQSQWEHDIGQSVGVQASPRGITFVDDPAHEYARVMRASISHNEDFSRIANGAPRAELLLPPPVRFVQGHTYRIQWSTMLPAGTRFDSQQFVIVTQVHQDAKSGPPALALSLQGARYAISQRGGAQYQKVSAAQWLCCADSDVGKWVHWELIYRPRESGNDAYTELRRDGNIVFQARGLPNAYPGDRGAYLKIGLYKPNWKKEPTDVDLVSMLYGPVTVVEQ